MPRRTKQVDEKDAFCWRRRTHEQTAIAKIELKALTLLAQEHRTGARQQKARIRNLCQSMFYEINVTLANSYDQRHIYKNENTKVFFEQ